MRADAFKNGKLVSKCDDTDLLSTCVVKLIRWTEITFYCTD